MTTPARSYAVHVALGFIAVLCAGWAVLMYQHRIDRREPLWQPGATVWNHRPVRVYFDPVAFADYADVLVASFGLWNHATDCQLVVRTKDATEADVIIRFVGTEPCGHSLHEASSPTWTCYAPPGAVTETRAMGATSGELLRYTHEGGHWLGLADRHDGSIMEPFIDDPQPGDPPPAALISGYLADAVRGRWCR